jgi:hypothetical protein
MKLPRREGAPRTGETKFPRFVVRRIEHGKNGTFKVWGGEPKRKSYGYSGSNLPDFTPHDTLNRSLPPLNPTFPATPITCLIWRDLSRRPAAQPPRHAA